MSRHQQKVAVVGATGVVGREMLAALQEAGFADENVLAFGSERSAGVEVEFAEDTLEVEKVEGDSFRGIQLALLATPHEASTKLAKAAQASGAWVVDASSAFHSDEKVPLVLPSVNADVLKSGFQGRVVSVPSATVTGLLTVAEPLRRTFGLSQLHYTALLPASHFGTRGVSVLERQTADLLSGREPDAEFFPHRMGFNVLPQVGLKEGPHAIEEKAMASQVCRIWAEQKNVPTVVGTLVQAPIFYGTCISLSMQLSTSVSLEQLKKAWEGTPDVKVLESDEEGVYPMPMLVTADPSVHVGRLRVSPGNWVHAFLAFDNAGFGTAHQAVTVGQRLLSV